MIPLVIKPLCYLGRRAHPVLPMAVQGTGSARKRASKPDVTRITLST